VFLEERDPRGLTEDFEISRRIRMDSQGSVRCQGTPTPNFYLHQIPHAMRWKQFINDFQQIPENQ